MRKKRNYVLIDSQLENSLELHVAFYGNDNEDQILCELTESAVIDLVDKSLQNLLPKSFEIDGDVIEYIKDKYLA